MSRWCNKCHREPYQGCDKQCPIFGLEYEDVAKKYLEAISSKQMESVATTPIFKVGQSARFNTTQSDLLQYDNCEVIVKRLLTEDECDIDEVGFMYEVETNGETFQAYQDELS